MIQGISGRLLTKTRDPRSSSGKIAWERFGIVWRPRAKEAATLGATVLFNVATAGLAPPA